jgi:HEAT repeat protein
LEAVIAAKSPVINAKFREMAGKDNPLQRMMAMYAMGRFGVKDNLSYIAPGLKDEVPDVRRTAVEALIENICPVPADILDLIRPSLADSERDVRLAAIEALSGCDQEESINFLLQGLRDEDPWIRARCAKSLGQKRLISAAPALADLLQEDNTLVVIKAIEALSSLGGEDAFKYLMPMMDHQNPDVQRAAEEALNKIRS